MHEGFRLEVDEDDKEYFWDELYGYSYRDSVKDKEKYECFWLQRQKQVKDNLEKYIVRNEGLDAQKIEYDWFPTVKADIFLSHSHQDEDFVESLAAWLYGAFQLRAFIDSRVWSYCENLLTMIDDRYCKTVPPQDNLFSYGKVKQSTSHVHMLLNGALTKMIDSTECFIFVGTANSLNLEPSTIKNGKYSTFSPWIYSEILTSRVIRHQGLDRIQALFEERGGIAEETAHPLKVKYDLDLSHLIKITLNDLLNLEGDGTQALDFLYKQKNVYW